MWKSRQAVRNVDLELRSELAYLGIFCLQKIIAQRDKKLKSRSMHNAIIPRTITKWSLQGRQRQMEKLQSDRRRWCTVQRRSLRIG